MSEAKATDSESGAPNDPSMQALVTITRLNHRPLRAESLVAGLPIEDGMLTPSLFVRAADRAGFSARYSSGTLTTLPTWYCPLSLF